MIAVLDSACAAVDGTSDKGLDNIVVGKALFRDGNYLFVDWVGMELLEN